MMASGLFAAYLLIHVGLLVLSFRMDGVSVRIWIIRALLVGMIWDNAMLVIGPWVIDAHWYVGASLPRYAMHAVFLPFLAWFGWSAMRSAGVKLAGSTLGAALVVAWIVVAIGWGFYHEVVMLELGPKTVAGHSRLVSLSGMPPVATILTNLFLLPMAVAVWRRAGWPWLFAGSLFIFVVNGATGALPWGFMLGNGAEVVFVTSLLATERFLARYAAG